MPAAKTIEYRYYRKHVTDEVGEMVYDEIMAGNENYIPKGAIFMLATGFVDHVGQKIYDKDVVRFTNKAPGAKWRRSHGDIDYNDMLVSWNQTRGAWHLYWRNADGDLEHMSLGKALDDNHAVVGNAYETPELAK